MWYGNRWSLQHSQWVIMMTWRTARNFTFYMSKQYTTFYNNNFGSGEDDYSQDRFPAKQLLMSPLGRQWNPRQNVWFLIVNIQTNRVAIVSSIITKIFRFGALFDSVFDYSEFDYSVYFSVLIQELYSRYFDHYHYFIFNNQPTINKHHTANSAIFVLV